MSRFVDGEGNVPLHHFTHRAGAAETITTDPARFATNSWTQAEKKAEGSNKTFFYVDPTDREENWFSAETPHYVTKYPAAKIYDASADKKRIVSRLRHIPRILAVLKRLGYHGMYYSGSFPTVAMWKPVELKKLKLARMKAPAGGAIANNQFQKGGQFLPKAFQRIRDVVAKATEWERKKVKLSLTPVLPPTIREQQTLTMPQLKSIEDEHGIADRHRLSRKAKELPNGNISAKSDDVAGFLEHLTNKRLSKDKIGKLVKSGAIKPEEKLVYLMNHMVHDAGWFNLGSDAGKWYGADVDAFDKGLKKLTGMKPHQIVLAKAVLAATSGGNKPIPNTLAMLRAIKAGLPEYNEPALHDWLHRAAKLNPDAPSLALRRPGRNLGEQLEWYKQFVAPHGKALVDPGYKTNRVRIVKATGEHVGTKEDDEWQYSPNARELYRQHGRKGMGDINLPSPDQSGTIQAKGWTSRGAQVAENIRRIKHLISVKGEEGAAVWLQTDHTDQEFANIFGRTPNRGYIPKNEKLPGAFILGPKFGPFFMNLNGKGKHLTADLWFARTWNRYLGSLFSAPGKQVKAPTSTTERRQMFHVAKKAADKLGLRSVSELQAVLWYYEQNLWRWFGSQTPSQTYRDGINEALKQHGHEPV